MLTTLRKRLFLSLFLALTLPLVSCDSGGSSDSSPAWVGTWEDQEDTIFWELSENEFRYFEVFELENDPDECELEIFEVIEEDGNTITVQGSSPNVSGDLIEFQFETSGDMLSATVLSASSETVSTGDEFNLSSVEDIPLSEDDCETTD